MKNPLSFQLLSEIFDHLPFGVAFINHDHLLTYFNRTMAAEFHYSEERIGKSAVECHQAQNQAKVALILDNFKSGKKDRITRLYVTPNSQKKLLTQYLPMYDLKNQYLGSLCVIKDITGF